MPSVLSAYWILGRRLVQYWPLWSIFQFSVSVFAITYSDRRQQIAVAMVVLKCSAGMAGRLEGQLRSGTMSVKMAMLITMMLPAPMLGRYARPLPLHHRLSGSLLHLLKQYSY
jgi:hypothetical protein